MLPTSVLVAAVLVCLLALAALLAGRRRPEGFRASPSARARQLTRSLHSAFSQMEEGRPTYTQFKQLMGGDGDVVAYHRGLRLYRRGELTPERVEEFA